MMPDPQPVASFEQGFAALLDVIDRLRRLDPPKEPEGVHGVIRWMEDFKRAVSTMPTLPDTTQLSSFAEEVSQSVGEVEKAAAIGARGARGAGQAIGGINTNREPPPFMEPVSLCYGKVVALYDSAMAAYTNILASGAQVGDRFARYATIHPCSDIAGHNTNTDLTLYVEFPVVDEFPDAWIPGGDVYMAEYTTGVPYIPADTVLAFDARTARQIAIDETPYAISGQVVDRRADRMAPALKVDGAWPETLLTSVFAGIVGGGSTSKQLRTWWQTLAFDLFGRMVATQGAAIGHIITAKVTVGGADYDVEFTLTEI